MRQSSQRWINSNVTLINYKLPNDIILQMPRKWWIIPLVDFFLVLAGFLIFLQPGVQEWAGYHALQTYTRIKTWLYPPQEVAFSAQVASTLTGVESLDAIATLAVETTQTPATIDPQAPSLPSYSLIEGGTYYSQHNRWNYCGPANLAMLLSYWDWVGTSDDVARVIKPYPKDKNVQPYEMVDFIQFVGLDGLTRVGGDLDLLKRLIANGFPVLVEKGTHFLDIQNKVTWMGHYQVLNGYDDQKQVFIAQDSYIKANYEQPYEKLIEEWRSFNYTYIVAFQPRLRNDVLNLLGPDAEEDENYKHALQIAAREAAELSGVDQFFAYYNYGTNLVALRDYGGAAKAYDMAFTLYDTLPLSSSIRPYRILWYQTGPYFAYYYTGRYADVIDKATRNSIKMVRDDIPALEESYYWRGMAKVKIGDQPGAVTDFYTCLEYHKFFDPCVRALNDLGIYP